MNIWKNSENYKVTATYFCLVFWIFIASCSDPTKDSKVVPDEPMTLEQFDSLHRDNSKFLKEKELTNYILFAQTISPNKMLGHPFDTLKYDKIIAYDFEGSEEPYPSVLDKNLKFVPVILN